MDSWKVMIFIRICMLYASMGYVNVDNQSLICLYEELLFMVCYFGDCKTEVTLNVTLGELCRKIRRLKKSIDYLKRAVVTAMRTNSKYGQACGYVELGATYGLSGEYRKAFFCIKKCQDFALETSDRMLEGIAYRNLGIVYQSKGEFWEAIRCHEKQLRISQEIGDKLGESWAYKNLGETYTSLGKHQEALKCHNKRLNMYLTSQMCDQKGEGLACAYIGDTYLLMGKPAEAKIYHEKYLHSITGKNDKSNEATANKCLGMDYEALRKRNKAISHYKRLQVISTELGDMEGQRDAYVKLKENCLCFADYYDAIKNEEHLLNLVKAKGHKISEGRVCRSLGFIYDEVGEYEKAGQYNEEALKIAIETRDREGEGQAYCNLCRTYPLRGKYEEAIRYAKKSIAIAKEIGDEENKATAFTTLGLAYIGQSKFDEAKSCFEKSLEIAKKKGMKSLEGCAKSNLGIVFKLLRQYSIAIEYFEEALKINDLLNQKIGQHNNYFNLGSTYYYLGIDCIKACLDIHLYNESMSKSKKYLRKALKCCERIFGLLKDCDDLKVSVTNTFTHINKFLTEVLIEVAEIKEALLVSERGKAQALSDLFISKYRTSLGNAQCVQLEYEDVQMWLSENDVCLLYFSMQKSVTLLILAPQSELVLLQNDKTDLSKAELDYDGGNRAIEEILAAAFEKMGIKDVKCEKRSLELPGLSQTETEKNLSREESRRAPEKGNIGEDKYAQLKTSFIDPLEALYSALFTPTYVLDLTQEDVVIIPDGALYKVPFAALRDPGTGRFLSDIKCIRLAPSLTTLKILQECPADYHSKTGALVVGDPNTGTVVLKGKETTLAPLPKARHEATIVGSILNVEPVIGVQATKDAVKERLREGVAVIHIAAHGNTDGEIALAPCEITGGKTIPEEEDYLLTMKEVQETGIRAQLVVLSCCHSGRGEIKAEGVVGISRAFLAAGARAVIASLWAIDDEATLNFMVSFYTHLKMGEKASKSLQQAMKEMREEGYDEPMHWAPFFLIGDEVTISF